jgi:uncharacterized membrane protein
MNDPLTQQLLQAVTAYGPSLLEDRARLEQLLAGGTAESPGKVKALLILLDKKAVSFLANWAKETRADKGTYEQLRQKVAAKFEQANLLTVAAASWALDAWAVALGVKPTAQNATPGGLAPQPRPSAAQPAGLAAGPAGATARSAAGPQNAASAQTPKANVYAPPTSRVEDVSEAGPEGTFIEGGRSLAAGRGWAWLVEGWNLFKQHPGIWILNLILFMVISIVVQIVPFVGGLASALLSPVLLGGMMLGAHAVHMGEPLEVAHLFAGFKERAGPLVVVGLLYLLGIVAIVVVIGAVVGVSFIGLGRAPQMALGTIVLAVLLGVLLVCPLMMAYYYAPALVAVGHRGAFDAMKMSFRACLKNIMAGLVYFLALVAAAIVATIPLGLGWFILGPVTIASVYAAYRDIFYE